MSVLDVYRETGLWVFKGKYPTEMYLDTLLYCDTHGDTIAPRGKTTKTLWDTVFRFTEPTNQVTFLKGRKINPFFQLAESIWILSGRADVSWLAAFNANMAQFSDDGVNFNAPYGERLRSFNKNELNGFLFNPIDQLIDVYKKIKHDIDTRQAVAVLWNPLFDSAEYTIASKGKDIPCNWGIMFRVRNGKLDMSVVNRSNDLHWGLFGANLCQFTFIQMTMATWLGIPCGTYQHSSNNLHIYLDDYGAECTQKIYKANEIDQPELYAGTGALDVDIFEASVSAPPIEMPQFEQFNHEMLAFWQVAAPYLQNIIKQDAESIKGVGQSVLKSDYAINVYYACAAYRFWKEGRQLDALDLIDAMSDTYWKVSCYDFICSTVKKSDTKVREAYSKGLNGCSQRLTGQLYHPAFERWAVKYE